MTFEEIKQCYCVIFWLGTEFAERKKNSDNNKSNRNGI